MKITCTKWIASLLLSTSQCLLAQVPLLPLFENNTVGWTKSCYAQGGICTFQLQYTYTTHDGVKADTLIDRRLFKIIQSNTRHSNPSCNNGAYSTHSYLSFANNTMLTYDAGTDKVDTMYQFRGTGIGDKVLFFPGHAILTTAMDTLEISAIDSLPFANKKIRVFTLRKASRSLILYYADGIGFYHSGVFSTNICNATTYWFESGAALMCYEKDGVAYRLISDGENPLAIARIEVQTEPCENPLVLDIASENIDEVLVKVVASHRLETSQGASTVEIYNTVGSLVLHSSNTQATDIATLLNGVYIADISFQNGRRIKYKFVVRQ